MELSTGLDSCSLCEASEASGSFGECARLVGDRHVLRADGAGRWLSWVFWPAVTDSRQSEEWLLVATNLSRVRVSWQNWPGAPGVSTFFYGTTAGSLPTQAQIDGLRAFFNAL